MKRQRAEISSNVISHIKSAHPIEMWRSNKLGIKEKISRGNFPRLIFSCPVPSGLPHRSHCVPMNMNRSGYGLHLPLTGSFPWVIPPFAVMITKTCVEMMIPFIIPHSSVFWTVYVPPPNFLSRRLDKHDIMKITDVNES